MNEKHIQACFNSIFYCFSWASLCYNLLHPSYMQFIHTHTYENIIINNNIVLSILLLLYCIITTTTTTIKNQVSITQYYFSVVIIPSRRVYIQKINWMFLFRPHSFVFISMCVVCVPNIK